MKSAIALLQKRTRAKKVAATEKTVCHGDDAIIKPRTARKKEPAKKHAPKTEENSKKVGSIQNAVKKLPAARKVAPIQNAVKKLQVAKKVGVKQRKPVAVKKVVPVNKAAAVKKIFEGSKKPVTDKLVAERPVAEKPVAEKPQVSKKKKQEVVRKSSVRLKEELLMAYSIDSFPKPTNRKRKASESFVCKNVAPADVLKEKRKVEQMWRKTKQSLSLAKSSSKRGTQANNPSTVQFSDQYEIFGETILGSGQFGRVYAAIHQKSKEEVAVKVITLRSVVKKRSIVVNTLKSEVAILQAVDHPGIIKLKDVFYTTDQIYVVLEKMDRDMLEKILSQSNGRVVESIAKFMVVQIVHAVCYLHSKGIAHCDLKPDNVLLSDFQASHPQLKLCDFGYSKFIGDKQRLRKVVGTPAYLAPEVLLKKGYNKSVDMWSIGVIIYVTLSGSFPFDEGEDVASQLENVTCFFPTNPWSKISDSACELIKSLLRIQITERLTIEQCLDHEWLRDAEVHEELLNLERRLGVGHYLTSVGQNLHLSSSKRPRRA